MNKLKVLAVADPAVKVYTDKKYNILSKFENEGTQVIFDIIPWEDYFPTMMKAFEGSADYDVVMIAGHLWLADFVSKGYLAPLQYDFEDILPVIAKEMQYKGITYLSPSFCDGHMIVYRKSIFQKYLGELLPRVLSANEFVELVLKLNERNVSDILALKAHQSEILLDALPYLRSTGLDVYSGEGSKAACHIDQMTDGLEKYLSLKAFAPKDTYTYGNAEIGKLIARGGAAIAVTWSGQLGVVLKECEKKEDLGFSTFDTAWNVTWSFAVTNSPGNKAKAREFLKYLRSAEVDKLVGEYSGAPVRKSNYLKKKKKFPWYDVQLEMIEKYAKPFTSILGAGKKNDILYEEIFHAFTGKKDAKTALLNAKAKIDSL